MARCKDCIHEKVCNRDVGHGYSVCPHFLNAADVVPKSEVERLEKENETLTINMNAYGLAAKRLAEEKSEVAREIFEEIERWLGNYNGCRIITYEKYAELKKKYTEGEK